MASIVRPKVRKAVSKPKADKLPPVDQRRRFEEAARELGCDDDPERFKETVRKIAKAPPAPGLKKPKGEKDQDRG